MEDERTDDVEVPEDPEALDRWLRRQLGRRLRVEGLTLTRALAPGGLEKEREAGGAPDTPDTALATALARYEELWVRWATADAQSSVREALACAQDADALLLWLPEPSDAGTLEAAWPMDTLRALIQEADSQGLRDRAMLALVGPGASRALARGLAFDDGFGAGTPPGRIVVALARETVAREQYRRRGSSPPCYL